MWIFVVIIIAALIADVVSYQILIHKGATNKELERFSDGFIVGMVLCIIILLVFKLI